MWFPNDNDNNNNPWNPPLGGGDRKNNSQHARQKKPKQDVAAARPAAVELAVAQQQQQSLVLRDDDDVPNRQHSLLRLLHLHNNDATAGAHPYHPAMNSVSTTSVTGSGLTTSFQPTADMSRDASVQTMRSILLGRPLIQPTQAMQCGGTTQRSSLLPCGTGGGSIMEAPSTYHHHEVGLLLSQLQRQRTMANLVASTIATTAVPLSQQRSVVNPLAMASCILAQQQPGIQQLPQVSTSQLPPCLGGHTTTNMSPIVSQYLILNALQQQQQAQVQQQGPVHYELPPVACCALPTNPSGHASLSLPPSTSESRPQSLSGQKRSLDALVAAASHHGRNNNDAPIPTPTPLLLPGTIPVCLPVRLACSTDRSRLSVIQAVLREQIEVFEAGDEDVATYIRGRNKLVKLGQVGIRCRHCAHRPVTRREKGSTYYPTSVWGIYQASQNMWKMHLETGLCTDMPRAIQTEIAQLEQSKQQHQASGTMPSGAGRAYWAETAQQQLGLVDTVDGMYFIRNLPPNAQFPQLDNDGGGGVYRKTSSSSSSSSKRSKQV